MLISETAFLEGFRPGRGAHHARHAGLEPVVRRETSYDDQRLAGPLGHRSDAGQASQGLIVSPAQRIVCFCEQRGEDDPADAGERAQDFPVTLPLPSRRVLRGGRRSGQRCDQAVAFAIGLGTLREDDLDMSDRWQGTSMSYTWPLLL